MLRSIFTKTLHDDRSSLMSWSVAMLGVSLVYVAGHKQYAEAGFLDAELPEYLGAIMGAMDFGSPEGYLNATVFTLLGATLVVIFSLMVGVRAIAGDEDSGMLDLLLAYPVSRTRIVLERFAALSVEVTVIVAAMWAGVSVSSAFAEMGVPILNIAAICTGLALLGIIMGGTALAVGALTGSRGLSVGITTGVALAAFLVNNLAPMFEGLDTVRKLSPYYYYLSGDPLRNGFDLGGLAVLAGIALALLGLAIWGLNRRDVRI
jgi:ABC-2 type transport system permease protein